MKPIGKPVYTLSQFQPDLTTLHGVRAYSQFVKRLATHCEDIEYLVCALTELSDMQHSKDVWEPLYANPHAIHWIEQQLEEDPTNVCWHQLSSNPNAIHLLEKHLDKVDWYNLSSNVHAVPLLEKNWCRVVWFRLACNPSPQAIPLLERYIQSRGDFEWFWFWAYLSRNPHAVPLLEKHMDRVNWDNLSDNPNAIHLLEKYLYKINWVILSRNPGAITLFEKPQHRNKIDWHELSRNPNPNAISLLETNMDKLNNSLVLHTLAKNPNATHLMEQCVAESDMAIYFRSLATNPNAGHLIKPCLHPLKSEWVYLGDNPNVAQILGTLDFSKMRANCQSFACELAEAVFHPARLLRLCDIYEMDLVDYMELIGD